MRRGEIYLIRHRENIGAEIAKARPGVIVSNNILNSTSGVVEVVYLTTKPKKDLPTHALIHATCTPSTALCEQIDSVAIELIGSYCGTCSEEEMERIDRALLASLGIDQGVTVTIDTTEIAKITAERDVYKTMVQQMLRQGVCGA
jgi:mRNA interferase MazF